VVDTDRLEAISRKMRRRILQSVALFGRGHIGGSLSVIDILVTIYFSELFHFPCSRPTAAIQGDSMILSKGHAGVALYAVLSEKGCFSSDELQSLNQGGLLAEHPAPNIPGVNFLSGSLGHGMSLAAGLALGMKKSSTPRRSLAVVGDGELYEGTNWEAAQFAGHHGLNTLCVVIDRNRLITHGDTEEISGLDKLDQKWRAFGWEVLEINGHSHADIYRALAKFRKGQASRPLAVIANTVKGRGVSFMENRPEWHHGPLSSRDVDDALAEVDR